MTTKQILILSLVFFSLECAKEKKNVYTLYRSSAIDSNLRIHIATFDEEGADKPGFEGTNRDQCDLTVKLYTEMTARSGSTTKYWCEKDYFTK